MGKASKSTVGTKPPYHIIQQSNHTGQFTLRFFGGNGEKMWTTEAHPDERDAQHAYDITEAYCVRQAIRHHKKLPCVLRWALEILIETTPANDPRVKAAKKLLEAMKGKR